MRTLIITIVGLLAVAVPGLGQAADTEIKTDYVTTNGIKFHYAHKGDGDLVVFLHGFPAFWYMWKDQLEDIGADHQAVAPDMRGINLSTIPPAQEQYQAKYLIEDVKKFAEAVGGEKGKKFILVGHDWGGLVAWMYAMHYPERCRSL